MFLLSKAGVGWRALRSHRLPLLAAGPARGFQMARTRYSEQHRLSAAYLLYDVTSEVPHG